jgi:hypothetical protein
MNDRPLTVLCCSQWFLDFWSPRAWPEALRTGAALEIWGWKWIYTTYTREVAKTERGNFVTRGSMFQAPAPLSANRSRHNKQPFGTGKGTWGRSSHPGVLQASAGHGGCSLHNGPKGMLAARRFTKCMAGSEGLQTASPLGITNFSNAQDFCRMVGQVTLASSNRELTAKHGQCCITMRLA